MDVLRVIHSESSTSERKKQLDQPDVTIYYKRVLVMIGEEKAVSNQMSKAEEELDGYFNYWNPLAFGRLPLVMAFVAASTKLQFYYYYLNNKPERERICNISTGGNN